MSIQINDLLTVASGYADRAITLRRTIHRRPEMGNEERETSELVARTLSELGWEVFRPVGTSVVGLLRGAKPGRTVGFRADMDALRIQEATALPYASGVPGVMHACGHDFHTAALLGTAMLLTDHRDALCGNVKLFFQPDEEGDGGAQRMMAAGCMDDPHVDAVFGAHVDPDLPAGTVGLKYGKMYAASDTFSVTIHGSGCHGASPHNGIDAIAIGAQVVTAIQQLVSRRVDPTDSAVVSVGTFHAGTQQNAIAETAIIKGIIRTLGPETRRNMRGWFTDAVTGICAAMGAQAEIELRESYPGIVNHDIMVDLALETASDVLGRDRVRMLQVPTMGTEDFGYFIQNTPGAFYLMGVRNPEIGAEYPLHSARFIPDEAAMAPLIALHAGMAFRFLSQKDI